MNLRPLTVADAPAFAAFCQHSFPFFQLLQDYRQLGLARQRLQAQHEGRIFGLHDLANQLQGIIRLDTTSWGGYWEVSYAKAPQAPRGICITLALEQVMRQQCALGARVFTAQVNHHNLPSQQVMARLGFQIFKEDARLIHYRRPVAALAYAA